MNTSQFKELLGRMEYNELIDIQNWLDDEISTRRNIIAEAKTPWEDIDNDACNDMIKEVEK